MNRILLSVPHMSGQEEAWVHEAFVSNWLSTKGPNLDAFERAVEQRTGVHAVALGSGTAAIHLGLRALGVGPGDRVFCSTLTFVASCNPIRYLGAEPVFVDSEPSTWNLDPNLLEDVLRRCAAQGRLPRALVAVHLYGQCADMDGLRRLSDEFGLAVIEDAAQAIGASWGSGPKQRRAGSIGAAAAFSFYPTKNLSAYGDAGLVTTNSEEIAAHMRRLRNHGSPQRYVHEEFGWNCRLDAMQAAVLRVKLKYVEEWNEARRERAARYDQLFAEAGLTADGDAPENSAPIRLPYTDKRAHHVFHQYVVRAFRRDELREFLTARKIGTEIYYPIPLHLQPCFAYLGYLEGDLPEAERAAKEVLALPMFPELTGEEQRRVVKSIADFYC